MTVTRRLGKSFVSLFLLGCLLTPSIALSKGQNVEQTDVWRVIENFFAAFAQKDLAKVMALWSQKSPDLALGRQSIAQTFSAHQKIEVQSLRQDKIVVEKDRPASGRRLCRRM